MFGSLGFRGLGFGGLGFRVCGFECVFLLLEGFGLAPKDPVP